MGKATEPSRKRQAPDGPGGFCSCVLGKIQGRQIQACPAQAGGSRAWGRAGGAPGLGAAQSRGESAGSALEGWAA